MKAHNHIRTPPLSDHPRSRDSPASLPLAFSYSQALLSSPAEAPLSMRFMHKPSRARIELEKAKDPTKQNSIANSQLHPHDPLSSVEVSSDECRSNSHSPVPKADTHIPTSPPLPDSPHSVPESPDTSGHALVRKKSGEVVKSLLKESSASIKYRSRSLPSTPTYKQVHFGGGNDVKYFKSKDRPAAILALNSPTQFCDDDDDDDSVPHFSMEKDSAVASLSQVTPRSYFDYYDDELNSHVDARPKPKASPASHSDWNLEFTNFAFRSYHERITLQHRPLFLENMFVSIDGKYILGQVAVLNLAYEKSVTIRYSLDSWSTIVEIQAFYVPDSPTVLKSHNYDRFMFKISLDLFVNCFPQRLKLTTQAITLEMCIRFASPGQEIWDNNDQQNYKFVLNRDGARAVSPKLPQGAKTKQDTHTKKPKYSSSYLKKRHSTPNNAEKRAESPKFFGRPPWALPEYDDFQNNSYYLSSPLLKYTAKNNFKDLLIDDQLKDGDPYIEGRTFSTDFSSNLRISDTSSEDTSPSPERSQAGPPPGSKKPHESMTYKELLDSYCFFNSDTNDGGSKTTLVLSEEPGTHLDPTKVGNNGLDPVFTVSSFLK